jgi:type I restriction enzyme S subunit
VELALGYKQTEAGVIPQSWNVTTIGDEFSIQLGKMLDAEKNVGVPKPYLGNRAVQWGQIDLSDIGFIKLTSSDLQRFRLREGDLLVCEGGEIGRAAIWRQPIEECYYQKALHRLRPLHGYNVKLMLYVLQRFSSTGLLLNFVTQTSIAHLPKDKFATIPIPLPPTKAEQEAIAEALSDADALIESLEELIVKKRHLKQGAMQELLTGKRRLPGFEAGGDYYQTEAGIIPADWATKRLGELFEITSSKRVFQSEWKSEGIPFYRARELAVLGEKGHVENDLFISKEMYDSFKNTYGVPEAGDMLVTGVGTLGKTYVVSDDRAFYFKDGNIIWFKVRGKVRSEFLQQLFLTRVIIKQIDDASAGTTVGTYTITGAKKTTIPFPSLAEQEAITAVLSDMDKEIATLEAKLAKARQLKQGMMQELLTGRTRLI